MATVADLRRQGERRLAEAGVEAAALDAELLLRHVTGWDRASLVTRDHEEVPADVAAHYRRLVEQRALRRPLQHLTGRQAFWRHDFEVTRDVLIPRPETELLVEAALRALENTREPVVVDVGTGSGCIALSLAAERADAEVHATDTSRAALEVARRNARRLGLVGRVRYHEGDLLDPVRSLAGRIDLVACNPPYVGSPEELASLYPEVRDHEPAPSLLAAEGWRSLYQRLAVQARELLRPGGFLVVEVGRGQAEAVAAICRDAGLETVEIRRDLQEIPRTVVARRLH